jgi:hypothetical protein
VKDINNIEDWYRDELSNYNVEPNNNGWDTLADDLDANTALTDDNISEWYKKEASKLEERPDYTVWTKLSTNLDTTSVWERLSVSLTRHEQVIWWRNFIIRGIAVLLLLVGSYASYERFSNTDITNKKNDSNTINSFNEFAIKKDLTTNRLQSNKKNTTKELVNTTNQKQLITSKNMPNIHRNKNTATNNNQFIKATPVSINSLSGNKSKSIETNLNTKGITEQDISSGYEKKEFLVKKKKNKIIFNNKRFSSHFAFGVYARRFYLGANFGMKKQGMITSIKKNSALGEFHQQSFLNFGNTFGSTFGWIVSDKLNVETNLNFISTAGFNRAFSNESTTIEEELKLKYTTLNILAKKMSNKSTFDNKKYSTNLIGGVYAGYLISSSSVINGNSFDNNNFKNIDFGIVLGIEQDRYITKSFVITPGLRYQQGLINIANGSNTFQSVRNFAIEFNLGIKYIFLKKG